MSDLLSLNARNVISAAVSAALVAVMSYVLMVGDVFTLNWSAVINTAVMAGLGSLLKSFLTDEKGKFVGVLPLK